MAWLEDSGVTITIARYLKAVVARKPKNIRELETFAFKEWAKILVDDCKKLV